MVLTRSVLAQEMKVYEVLAEQIRNNKDSFRVVQHYVDHNEEEWVRGVVNCEGEEHIVRFPSEFANFSSERPQTDTEAQRAGQQTPSSEMPGGRRAQRAEAANEAQMRRQAPAQVSIRVCCKFYHVT